NDRGGDHLRCEHPGSCGPVDGGRIVDMNWKGFFHFREIEDEPKPFLDHLEELRRMLIKMIIVLGGMMALAFAFQGPIIAVIERPLAAIDVERTSLVNLGVADPLTISIQLAFYAGLV